MVSANSSLERRISPDHLPGERHERVFIGGHYDFMPTLRLIDQFIRQISCPEKRLVPIIPLDYDIEVEQTIDWDIEILNRCRYAIFDLSDLGAQLVEMQCAKEKPVTRTETLLIYPVRERVNEPQRGRRTVLSFGLPHFGYMTFDELRGIVWRFLMGAPVEKDHSPRVIHDPILDAQIRRIRVLLGQSQPDRAKKIAQSLLNDAKYKNALEPRLLMAVIACRTSDNVLLESSLDEATKLTKDDEDMAEVWYYRGIIERLQTSPDWGKAKANLLEAEKLRPNDGCILQLLGYVLWETDEKSEAIEKTRKSLCDTNMPDPLVAVQAVNNLGYFLCEHAVPSREGDLNLEEALEVTKYLCEYHKVFRRGDGTWLDTRGWVLTLQAETLAMNPQRREEAKNTAKQAVKILEDAEQAERDAEKRQKYIVPHLQAARNLESNLSQDAN
jgi:tetratricopeptide (TPR) repeat protein